MPDRYQIISQLASGGSGTVLQAYDTKMERYVALKRLRRDGEGVSAKEREALSRETSTLSQLQHPNIVTVFDIGEDDQGLFIVMELIEGVTFHDLSSPTFSAAEFHGLASQCLEALDAAEKVNIIHRDLKPANIMAVSLPSGRRQVKVLDFGLAKFHEKPEPQTLDQNQSIMGSIHFMAPEQFGGNPVDKRADIYALGCVFYYLLTRVFPFNGGNPRSVMAAHVNHHVRPLEERRPDLPEILCRWVMWMINRAPSSRPANARDALSRLPPRKLLAAARPSSRKPFRGVDADVPTAPHPTAAAPTLQSKPALPKWLPALWIVAFLGLCIGLYFTFRKPKTVPAPAQETVAAAPAPAQASGPVFEDFSYSPSSTVLSRGGKGWNGRWSAALNIVAGDLPPASGSAGAHLKISGTVDRDLTAPFLKGPLWVSFVAKLELGAFTDNIWGGVDLRYKDRQVLFLGKTARSGVSHKTWGFGNDSVNSYPPDSPVPLTADTFIVCRLEVGGKKGATLWLNPPAGKIPDDSDASARLTNFRCGGVDSIRVGTGGKGVVLLLDSLRLGSTPEDVLN